MLDLWNSTIYTNVKNRLAMKLVHAERNGELVIGLRESYGNNYFLRKHFTCVTIHHFI